MKNRVDGFKGFTKEQITAKLAKSFEFTIRPWGGGFQIRVKRNGEHVNLSFQRWSVLLDSYNSKDSSIDLTGHADDWKRIRASVNRRLNKTDARRKAEQTRRQTWNQDGMNLRTILGKYISLDRMTVTDYGDIVIDNKLTLKKYQVKQDVKQVKFQGFRVSFDKLETFMESVV